MTNERKNSLIFLFAAGIIAAAAAGTNLKKASSTVLSAESSFALSPAISEI